MIDWKNKPESEEVVDTVGVHTAGAEFGDPRFPGRQLAVDGAVYVAELVGRFHRTDVGLKWWHTNLLYKICVYAVHVPEENNYPVVKNKL